MSTSNEATKHDFEPEGDDPYAINATCRVCGEHRGWWLHK